MAKQCEMMIGFLIPRRCNQKARSTCIRCGKAICDEHAVITSAGILCEACHLGVEMLAAEPPRPEVYTHLPGYGPEDTIYFETEDTGEDLFSDLS
ncbi:MAG TPA: hypothetical protein ENK56_03215 [Chloroflexi bacterium]|nr:hypothetical protein [Chloroflexota bacterium]